MIGVSPSREQAVSGEQPHLCAADAISEGGRVAARGCLGGWEVSDRRRATIVGKWLLGGGGVGP